LLKKTSNTCIIFNRKSPCLFFVFNRQRCLSVTGISKEEYLTAIRNGEKLAFVCVTCLDLAYRTAYDDEQRKKSSAWFDVASAAADDDDDDDQEETESDIDMSEPTNGDHDFVVVSSNFVVTRYFLAF